ncbi:MAG: hypothetical protein H6624_16780 [Bdellovibrionaceae bacterium]|nr:hypothetical protein [Bdellovibrionales bacterium]MCB9086001.1 hypothetical protein [Pseudobdellovibrionaceae bacterium]
MDDIKFKPLKLHKNFKKAQRKILEDRKKLLSSLLKSTSSEILKQFECDLFGVKSGRSDERSIAREWLLRNYGPLNKNHKGVSYGELRLHLESFDELTVKEVNRLAEKMEINRKEKSRGLSR